MLPGAPRPIGSVPRADLDRLFDEEAALWSGRLSWSFAPTRRRLEEALEAGGLAGFAVVDPKGACAYATYAAQDGQGLVGSFFSSERVRGRGIEGELVGRILDSLIAQDLRVIDCQTLFSSDPDLREPFVNRGFESAGRVYMSLDRTAWEGGRNSRPVPVPGFRSRPIHRGDLRSVARLVYHAHQETHGLDASSSFDTLESCEKILGQVLLDHVCGPFDSLGSRRVELNGEIVTACLLTWPEEDVAHISEVATARSHRLQGLARQCVTESLASAFERSGARSVTLSVTASNRAALALYEPLGFEPRVRYQSHVLRRAPR